MAEEKYEVLPSIKIEGYDTWEIAVDYEVNDKRIILYTGAGIDEHEGAEEEISIEMSIEEAKKLVELLKNIIAQSVIKCREIDFQTIWPKKWRTEKKYD